MITMEDVVMRIEGSWQGYFNGGALVQMRSPPGPRLTSYFGQAPMPPEAAMVSPKPVPRIFPAALISKRLLFKVGFPPHVNYLPCKAVLDLEEIRCTSSFTRSLHFHIEVLCGLEDRSSKVLGLRQE